MPLKGQIDDNWRPKKMDSAAIYQAAREIRTTREAYADVHLFTWLTFGKDGTKDLTYREYEETLRAFEEHRPEESM